MVDISYCMVTSLGRASHAEPGRVTERAELKMKLHNEKLLQRSLTNSLICVLKGCAAMEEKNKITGGKGL